MTAAVCFECGKIKRGAFVPCPECGAMPWNEDDCALSYAMTDWYFDKLTLEEMGERIASGHPMTLAPQTREQIINDLRESGILDHLGNPSDVKTRLARARHYLLQGQVKQATREVEEVLRQEPENAVVHKRLGEIAMKQQKYEEAAKHFGVAYAFNPNDPETELALNHIGSLVGKDLLSE